MRSSVGETNFGEDSVPWLQVRPWARLRSGYRRGQATECSEDYRSDRDDPVACTLDQRSRFSSWFTSRQSVKSAEMIEVSVIDHWGHAAYWQILWACWQGNIQASERLASVFTANDVRRRWSGAELPTHNRPPSSANLTILGSVKPC